MEIQHFSFISAHRAQISTDCLLKRTVFTPACRVVLHNLGNSLYNKRRQMKEAVTNEENTKAGFN